MGKTFCKAKTPPGEFKVTIPKNLLINNQAIISIRNLTITLAYPIIPTYSWTFTSIPNWTWSCSSVLSFDAQISNLWLIVCTDPSTWLTPATWMIVVGCKVLHFINNEDQEALGYKTLKRTKCSSFTQSIWVLDLCIQVWRLLKSSLYIYLGF